MLLQLISLCLPRGVLCVHPLSAGVEEEMVRGSHMISGGFDFVEEPTLELLVPRVDP